MDKEEDEEGEDEKVWEMRGGEGRKERRKDGRTEREGGAKEGKLQG